MFAIIEVYVYKNSFTAFCLVDTQLTLLSLYKYTLPFRSMDAAVVRVLYGEAPPRGPTPYPFIYHFFRKGTPFVYLLLEKGTPFIYLLKKTYE